MTKYRLMQIKSIAECILQYLSPPLRYHFSLRSLFCLFLSGRFTQVLLYIVIHLGPEVMRCKIKGLLTHKRIRSTKPCE